MIWLLACTCDADCRFDKALAALRSGDEAAMRAEIEAVSDPLQRDLVRLRVATVEPARAGKLCTEVTTDFAREKCQQVLGRPHLQGAPPP
ncbi:MAG: hypothetical protein FJ090_04355 [Deltaproteobacteria bacterium]|nr:hypothetical protein [Deltaproteobacteria bacterium]